MNDRKAIYLKGINGMRAIAALAVVFAHVIQYGASLGLDPYILGENEDGTPKNLELASYGVSIFFCISGFLITYLLCKEKERQGIDVKKFYVRRILRIWPLYYLYMLLCLLTYYLFSVDYESSSIFYYVFFSANVPYMLGGTLPLLVHYWTLGVEEQFYILWPWLNKLNNKRLFRAALYISAILVGLKIYLHIFVPNSLIEHAIHITRFHCMLFGALCALLYYERNARFINIATAWPVQLFCWACLFLVALNQFHIVSFLDTEIISLISCFVIVGQIEEKGLISLENTILDYLGKISYGIYVIHILVIFMYSKVSMNLTEYSIWNYVQISFLVLGTTIFLSHVSYRYYERPFLTMKKERFAVVASSGEGKV